MAGGVMLVQARHWVPDVSASGTAGTPGLGVTGEDRRRRATCGELRKLPSASLKGTVSTTRSAVALLCDLSNCTRRDCALGKGPCGSPEGTLCSRAQQPCPLLQGCRGTGSGVLQGREGPRTKDGSQGV